MPYQLNQRALEALKALVRAGKYVDRAWTFDASDSNALLGSPPNWTDYQNWFLGIDNSAAEKTKVKYAYPYGKGGVVYLSALRAIASRASAEGAGDISRAASDVLTDALQMELDKANAAAHEALQAFNENHDEQGKFSDGGGGAGGGGGSGGGSSSSGAGVESVKSALQQKERELAEHNKKLEQNKAAVEQAKSRLAESDKKIAELNKRLQELKDRAPKAKSSGQTGIYATADPNNRHQLQLIAPVVIAAAEAGEDGKPKGLPKFNMTAYTGGPMRLRGWVHPVVVDLKGVTGLDKARPILKDHDPGKLVGHSNPGQIKIEPDKISAEGVISGHGPHVDEVVRSSLNGAPWQASIGARVLKQQFIPQDQSVAVNGRQVQGPVHVARKTLLGEISFVALGADDDTSARIAANAAKGFGMNFEKWLEAMALSLDSLSEDQKTKLKAKFDAEQKLEAKNKGGDGDDDEEDEDSVKAGKDAECDDDEMEGEEDDDEEDDDEEDDDEEEDEDDEEDEKPSKKAKSSKAAKGKKGAAKAKKAKAARVVDIKAMANEAINATRKAAAKEQRRIAKIEVIAADHADICAKAIEDGWDVTKTELHVLRADRPKASGIYAFNVNTGKGSEPTAEIVASACALAGGVSEKAAFKGLNDQQKEIAASKQIRKAAGSIYGLCSIIAATHGVRLPSHEMDRDILATMQRIEHNLDLQASTGGMSTMSLSGITENILNKAMLESYGLVDSVVGDVCWETDTNDFKQYKRYRLTAAGILAALGAAGELKSISLQDESYPNQVKTQGVILTIGREILLNDDMGALTQAPTLLGRGSALYREMLVFGNLLNATNTVAPGASTGQTANGFNFFSTGASNYLSGGSSALSITSLTSAVQKFREQTDANSMPIMLKPDRLLLPPALEVTAKNLFNGAELVVSALGSTSAKNIEPNINAHKGAYRPVVSPFLSASVGAKIAKLKGDPAFANFSNVSDTAWYLLTNPAGGFATLQIGYLRGQRVPIIERGETNFNQLGMAMRCYYDFGVALHDYRCGVMSAGA